MNNGIPNEQKEKLLYHIRNLHVHSVIYGMSLVEEKTKGDLIEYSQLSLEDLRTVTAIIELFCSDEVDNDH